MPRGFLVKRSRKSPTSQQRIGLRYRDEECERSTQPQENHSPLSSAESNGHMSIRHVQMTPMSLIATPKSSATDMLENGDTLNGSVICSPPPTPGMSPVERNGAFSTNTDHRSFFHFSPLTPITPLMLVPVTPPHKSGGPLDVTDTESEDLKRRKLPDENISGDREFPPAKKSKAARKIDFTMPCEKGDDACSKGDITFETFSYTDKNSDVGVERIDNLATPEAKAELKKIENKLGDYICQLCKEHFDDAFLLAQHKCSQIVHVEYRCPDCDKMFNCPANLASHRRWHKPRQEMQPNTPVMKTPPRTIPTSPTLINQSDRDDSNDDNNNSDRPSSNTNSITESIGQFEKECEYCGKKFRRQAYLRKHIISCHTPRKTSPTPSATKFLCQFCGEVFSNVIDRAKHFLTHSPLVPMKNHSCEICGSAFIDLSSLQKHRAMHLSEIPIYPCKYCSNIFYSSPGLTRHINKYHTSESPRVVLFGYPPLQAP